MIVNKVLESGYKYIEITNSQAEAKIALQGAHVFHYQATDKTPLLWLSELAYFKEGKAIRGGVPICFPWFGPHKSDATLPQHGFARTAMWSLVLEEEVDEGTTHVQLQLLANEKTKELWNYEFDVRLDVMVSSELTVALTVTNTDRKPFEISTALHTYFNISDIDNIVIEGLKESEYFNALDGKEYLEKSDVTIDQEVDRVYFNAFKNITLHDDSKKIELKQEGSNSLVVWNPWIEKSKQMADMSNGAYKTMVCLETGNVGRDSKVLDVGESHILRAVMK